MVVEAATERLRVWPEEACCAEVDGEVEAKDTPTECADATQAPLSPRGP
jgi:hypothetical protein